MEDSPEEAPKEPTEVIRFASTASDMALAAVSEAASFIMPTTMTVTFGNGGSPQFSQSMLKLCAAIKNLAQALRNVENHQGVTDDRLKALLDHVQEVEQTTMTLKSEQVAIVSTAKKAFRTSKQQAESMEFDRCLDPRSRVGSVLSTGEARLVQLENNVSALQAELSAKALQGSGEQSIERSAERSVERSGDSFMDVHELKRSIDRNAHLIQENVRMLRGFQDSINNLDERDRQNQADIYDLRQQLEEQYYRKDQLGPVLMEARIASMEQQAPTPERDEYSLTPCGQGGRLQGVEARLERNEARLDKSIVDLSDRLEPLQDFVEQQRLSSWQASRQLPDVALKLDQLWAQCQYYFSKVKEHDVHFGFLDSSFETHKQHWLGLADFPPDHLGRHAQSFKSRWLQGEDSISNRAEEEPREPAAAAAAPLAPTVRSPPAATSDVSPGLSRSPGSREEELFGALSVFNEPAPVR